MRAVPFGIKQIVPGGQYDGDPFAILAPVGNLDDAACPERCWFRTVELRVHQADQGMRVFSLLESGFLDANLISHHFGLVENPIFRDGFDSFFFDYNVIIMKKITNLSSKVS